MKRSILSFSLSNRLSICATILSISACVTLSRAISSRVLFNRIVIRLNSADFSLRFQLSNPMNVVSKTFHSIISMSHHSTFSLPSGYAAISSCDVPAISAVPRTQAFIDPRVWVFRCLGRGQFGFHALHPSAERVSAWTALGLRRFQPRFPGIGPVVGGTALGVQAAGFRFALLALPCG